MEMIEKQILTKDYLTRSNLPASDYVINRYVGCPHGCQYCYASFMKRFTGHAEEWGTFIDIKNCSKTISAKRLKGKTVFLSSVTDCYNPYEEKYCITRDILKQLVNVDCTVSISTKSSLILRDIGLLKQVEDLTVAMSINTLNENYPQYANLYEQIYIRGNKEYWDDLAAEIKEYCGENGIRYVNYFGHERWVEEKRGRVRSR